MGKHIFFLTILTAGLSVCGVLACPHVAAGQDVDSLDVRMRPADTESALRLSGEADSLRLEYRFSDALQRYSEAVALLRDTSCLLSRSDSAVLEMIETRRLMAENGLAMKDYVSSPEVVARHTFSSKDFYLYYPMKDKSWRPVPNQLDSIQGHEYVNATYIPDGVSDIYFSAVDPGGARNIYHTVLNDTIWSAPVLLDESLTSSGDEIFPVFSVDGRTLYFSSSGLYGSGGYDLYKTVRDPSSGTWSVPENLGFPYSSPYDDLLYYNTPDGKYTIFASDRGCSGDSVTVYVLEYDSMPVRHSVDDPEELERIAALVPSDDPSGMDTGSPVRDEVEESPDIARYRAKMEEIRIIRDSIAAYGQALEEYRARLAEDPDSGEKEAVTREILKREGRLPVLQDSLERASASLQKIEMEFLFSGVVIDPDKVMAQADREMVGASANYVFSRLSPGEPVEMKVARPDPGFDYSFMILPEGRFAEDNEIPDGIVYQIQIFLLSRPATVSQIKGLSPVFHEKTSNGNYIYRAGLFRTYNDVLSSLNKVKKLGFKSAFIVAFNDGRQVSVQQARTAEASVKSAYQVRIVSSGDSLPELTITAIRQVTDRDIARVSEDGRTVFIVGPIEDEVTANKLESMVRITGVEDTEVVKIGN